jgi:hypothetical protein
MVDMIAVGVIDVGSPRSGKLGWAILPPNGTIETGKDLDAFIGQMGVLAKSGPIAVGFEAPLFIPARSVAMNVLSGRRGEGSRPWSAGAGATVTAAALAVVTYTLSGLRVRLPKAVGATDWTTPLVAPEHALFFEAFVTGAAKGSDHADDARIAAEAAKGLLCGSEAFCSAIDEVEVFSLLGASLLRTGWSTDLGLLSTPCLVVKPGFEHRPNR